MESIVFIGDRPRRHVTPTRSLAPSVPDSRVRRLNAAPERPSGDYVLYWMTAQRRLRRNHALQRAVDLALALRRPLVVLEAIRVDYPHASDRLHRFALDGMAEHRRALAGGPVRHHAYVESEPGAGRGLLDALAARACAVIADDTPAFFLPRMNAAAAARCPVRLEAVDSCGLLPLRAADRTFKTARSFRRFLQGALGGHLTEMPADEPLAVEGLLGPAELPPDVERRWPEAPDALLQGGSLERLPIDHGVPPVDYPGGEAAARARLARFVEDALHRYGDEAKHPDANATSGLSPWIHWGHLSAHDVFLAVAEARGWSPARIGGRRDGARAGWWGLDASSEAFLDELVTWRELGFNTAWRVPGHDRWDTLPPWARATLEDHAADPRPALYARDDLEGARTDDDVWNAAQRELLGDGRVHPYLRMLWGKKILEWTASPREALRVMLHLNDRWAVDGRDPNSVSGITWILGRYDRGWPERAVFGKVRSMTSASTRRKLDLKRYLERWAAASTRAGESP